jgi:hypothetical protein
VSTERERTRPIHVLVGGWVAANGVLTGILFIYHPEPISVALYVAALVILSGFGVTVLTAARRGRVGAQRRMPVRGTSAVLAAVGLLLVGLGALYGWVLSLVGLAPLLAAAVQAGRERLRADARPWPVLPDDTPVAGPAQRTFAGIAPGTSVPVPSEHPAHQPPEPAPERPVGAVKAVGLGAVAARTVLSLLRRRGGRR